MRLKNNQWFMDLFPLKAQILQETRLCIEYRQVISPICRIVRVGFWLPLPTEKLHSISLLLLKKWDRRNQLREERAVGCFTTRGKLYGHFHVFGLRTSIAYSRFTRLCFEKDLTKPPCCCANDLNSNATHWNFQRSDFHAIVQLTNLGLFQMGKRRASRGY